MASVLWHLVGHHPWCWVCNSAAAVSIGFWDIASWSDDPGTPLADHGTLLSDQMTLVDIQLILVHPQLTSWPWYTRIWLWYTPSWIWYTARYLMNLEHYCPSVCSNACTLPFLCRYLYELYLITIHRPTTWYRAAKLV